MDEQCARARGEGNSIGARRARDARASLARPTRARATDSRAATRGDARETRARGRAERTRGTGARGRAWGMESARARAVALAERVVASARTLDAVIVTPVVMRARAFAREQWPPDHAWVAEVERVRELAAFEAYARATREAEGGKADASATSVDARVWGSEGALARDEGLETRVADVCAAVEALFLESPASPRRAAEAEADDGTGGDGGVERARAPSRAPMVSPSRDEGERERTPLASPSFDERDVVFEDSPEPEHRVLVVPRALALDGAALRTVQTNAVSFVPPREKSSSSRRLTGKVSGRASAYWSGRAESQKPLVVRVPPSSPPSPECPIPSPPPAVKTTAHPPTPPWYLKRIDRETRSLQRSARTLIDWTSETLRDVCPSLDGTTARTPQIPHISWFDVSECDAVALLTPVDDHRAKRE